MERSRRVDRTLPNLGRHFDQAEREFEAALEMNPALFEALYFYARACFARGDLASLRGSPRYAALLAKLA